MPSFKNITFEELCNSKQCFLYDNCIKRDLLCTLTAKDIRKILDDKKYIIIKRAHTMRDDIKTVVVCVEIIGESDLAYRVDDKDDAVKAVWLPKSQIKLEEAGGVGDTVNIEMPIWLARKNGLI